MNIKGSLASANARLPSIVCLILVGAEGFEPTTPASQTLCATRLRYAPTHTRSYVMDAGLSNTLPRTSSQIE